MYQIDFDRPQSVHFIGIGGISMSGLAEILIQEGFTVSGSDAHESSLTKQLEADGARIYYGQRADNIVDGLDVVVYTAAVHPDNPEYQEAVCRQLPMLSRAELLGQMMKNYRHAVAVAGTHGKTTTTSMLTEILLAADLDPTISVGGILHSIGGNIRVGGPELFVTEACEYTNSFLCFFPTIEVILNVEEDHLDFFKDLEDIRRSFRLFAQKLGPEGLLVINSDIPDYEELCRDLPCPVVTVGRSVDSDYSAGEITWDAWARPAFTLLKNGEPVGELSGLAALSLVDNNSIQDYSPLSRLTGLTSLTLDKSTSQDDPDLSGLTGLNELDMSGFISISFLRNMGNLRHLSIHGCNVDEIGALSGLSGLESLACYGVWTYGVPLKDVKFIDQMPNLKVLDFSGISEGGVWGGYQRNTEILGDISNVFNHQGLEALYLNNCMFEIDFDNLVENPSLKILEMREVNLKENFYVRSQGGMTDLWYDDVALDGHTDFLTKYPGLTRLYLDGNQLTGISFAASLKNLTHLGIRNNYVTELSPLDQAESLEFLDIRENPISGTVASDGKVEILR